MRRLGVVVAGLGGVALAIVVCDAFANRLPSALPLPPAGGVGAGAMIAWGVAVMLIAVATAADGVFGLLWRRDRSDRCHADPQGSGGEKTVVGLLESAGRTRGLDDAEVSSLRTRFGFNEVPGSHRGRFGALGAALWGPAPWTLEAIVVASILLGRPYDAGIAAALILVNAVVRRVEESRADAVVRILEQRLRIVARVCRSGEWQLIPARELLPGDVIRVRIGDVVPADLGVISGGVAVDASALTGESAEIESAVGGSVPAGAVVRRGEAEAIVTAIGCATRYGKTAELVKRVKPRSAAGVVIASVVRALLLVVGIAVTLLVSLLAWRGDGFADAVPLLLVLLSSAVPVALPAMLTVSMALGASELAASGVLVTRLDATEWAGTMDVLCLDKTGTITENKLRVVDVMPLGNATEDDVLRMASLASCAADQDPLDLAVLSETAGRHLLDDAQERRSEQFVPFDARRRRTEAIVIENGKRTWVAKGAVKPLERLCQVSDDLTVTIQGIVSRAGLLGRRVIAVAAGPEGGVPVFLGLVALEDPPRPEAAGLVARLRTLGVTVLMVSGDAVAVARSVGAAVGLSRVEAMGDTAKVNGGVAETGTTRPPLLPVLEHVDGLAEVYPEDKHRIVRALQESGHVVGMTGDGVNDAPALRQADVGIAVSGATDAARQAAGVVLCDPGLAGIVPLVEQGRAVQRRLRVWTLNKVSRTVFKSMFVIVGFLITGEFVVSALAMLLIVILSDVAKISIATDRGPPGTGPDSWHIGSHVAVAAVLGVCMAGEAIGGLLVMHRLAGFDSDPRRLHSLSLLLFVSFGVFSVISSREQRPFWTSSPSVWLGTALLVELLAGISIALFGLPDLPPIGIGGTAALVAWAAVACLGFNDAVKVALLWRLPSPRLPGRSAAAMAATVSGEP